jgi:hypothetical protein
MSAWYRTGTCTATNGSATVTGSLTAWLANAKAGDFWVPDAEGRAYEITAVNSNTSITISPVYAGSTGSGKAYGIARTSTAWNSTSELAVQIAEFTQSYDPLGLSALSDPNADKVAFWDDSASAMAWLTLSGLGISGTTMSVDTDLMSTARWAETSITAATTTDIGGATTPRVVVTGNTGITSFGSQPNRLRIVRFTGTPTITYNATSMILPGATNLSVTAGAIMMFASDASGNWRWLDGVQSDGQPLGMTAYSKTLTALANAAALRTAAGLVIGTDVQAYDADLDAIAALSTTSYGRALLALADAAALRTAAGLGTAATQNTGTSGANVPLLNGINTHSGGDTFTGPTRVQQAMFGLNGAATITVSSDSITPTQARHLLDTEGAASSDNLTTIVNTNTLDGDLLFLSTVNSSRDVIVQHLTGGGNILLLSGTNFTLGTTTSGIVLQRRGGAWYEQFRMTY